jgi:hypothetical protein
MPVAPEQFKGLLGLAVDTLRAFVFSLGLITSRNEF